MQSIPKRSHSTGARPSYGLSFALRCLLLAGAACALGPRTAAASDGTRSLTFHHTHTSETATITFRRDGRYDEEALNQLNWLLRDWRVDTPVKMDPRLFDILWEVYRESGSREPIHVISAYRSPATNGMLRQRSRGVSEHSQHMSGKAMDVRLPDVDPARLRAIAMRLQYGGVGYYASSNFVHIDTGSVRAWPRMSEEQLARLFPDGKTVHLPPSGKPLPGYEQARAEIAARDGTSGGAVYAGATGGPNLLSFLGRMFGSSGEAPPPPALAFAAAETPPPDLSSAPVPLPPRRPPPSPVQVAGGAWPLSNLDRLPAPVRPAMDWPAPDDHQAVIRALFTASQGSPAARPAPQIVLVRARPNSFEPSEPVKGTEPAINLAARFSKTGDDIVRVSFANPAPSPVFPVREANAAP